MKPNKAALKRLNAEYDARYAKWQRDQEAFIAEHGLAAYDAKVERKIRVLYPEEGQL